MNETEIWVLLEEFPYYKVSNLGRIARTDVDKEMQVSYTQHGHAKITLMDCSEERRTRSVALMVARAFVVPEYPNCDKVIVKNMDYSDVRASNLAWRPDGFAWEYAHQFKVPAPLHYQNLAVADLVHEKQYPNIIEAAADQGLLFKDIWHSTYSGDTCFPTRSIFVVISPT